MTAAQWTLHSPVGELTLSEEDGALVSLDWGRGPAEWQDDTPLLTEAAAQLRRYFDGESIVFDLPFRPNGTPFQRRVWAAMEAIPYGRTASYGTLARRLGSAPRAVGVACGRNPLPILVPCHRVIAADGGLGGYSGGTGVETKAALLRLEGARA